MKQMNTQQEIEEQHPMHKRRYPSRDAENGSFLLPQIQLLWELAPELSKTPPSQRNVVSTQCDGTDDEQPHQVTLVARSEHSPDIHVLSMTKRFELRPSETLGRLVAKRRESLGMKNDPLRLIRMDLTDEPRFGHGCCRSGGLSGMNRRGGGR
jgi:hypothetical protein